MVPPGGAQEGASSSGKSQRPLLPHPLAPHPPSAVLLPECGLGEGWESGGGGGCAPDVPPDRGLLEEEEEEEGDADEDGDAEEEAEREEASPRPPSAMTPIPLRDVMSLCFIQTGQAVAILMPLQLLVFMIRSMVHDGEASIARWTGLCASLFQLSQFVSAYPLGRLSDSVGRKPILVVGTVFSLLSMLALGFCQNVGMVAAVRIMGGLPNGAPVGGVFARSTPFSTAPGCTA